MFRSEEMALCQLFIQPEAGYSSVSILGEKGIVQFRDVSSLFTHLLKDNKQTNKFFQQLNPEVNAFQRKFVGEVRRCDEMERRLRYIEAEINKDGVKIPEPTDMPIAPNPREMHELEVCLENPTNPNFFNKLIRLNWTRPKLKFFS